jgi:hypothetical protein
MLPEFWLRPMNWTHSNKKIPIHVHTKSVSQVNCSSLTISNQTIYLIDKRTDYYQGWLNNEKPRGAARLLFSESSSAYAYVDLLEGFEDNSI